MKRIAHVGRRVFLVGAVALFAGFSPIPVPLDVANETTKTVRVRASSDEAWVPLAPGETAKLQTFNHAGLCRPPDRWLPDDFNGLELELPDGSVVEVTRAAFEADAEYAKERWTYRFRGEPPEQ